MLDDVADFLRCNYITFTATSGICEPGLEAINERTKLKGFAYHIPYKFKLGKKASFRHSFQASVHAGFH